MGWGGRRQKRRLRLGLLVLLFLSGCNYNYHRGLELERNSRFEEANIEFHRAYVRSPGNQSFREAYLRTAEKTTEELLERYDRYVTDKKYLMAFKGLQRARALTPDHPRIAEEQKKWFQVLIAGRVDLVEIKSLANQIPLTDQIELVVRINTWNASHRLEAPINYQTRTFSVEDILYDPSPDLLMMYSLNAIGVKLTNQNTRSERFQKFIDFRTPILMEVRGRLAGTGEDLSPAEGFYPIDTLRRSVNEEFWYPSKEIRYTLQLDEAQIRVDSAEGSISYLPQILYVNRQDRRFFLDFGHLQLSQRKIGGSWSLRRILTEQREYLTDLRKNVLLNTYFFYREGGFPFVLNPGAEKG